MVDATRFDALVAKLEQMMDTLHAQQQANEALQRRLDESLAQQVDLRLQLQQHIKRSRREAREPSGSSSSALPDPTDSVNSSGEIERPRAYRLSSGGISPSNF